jgi:CubicO group peptidase (beta-lactamase class C family)
MRSKRLLVFAAAMAAVAFTAADVPSPQGRWRGAIELPGQSLEVLVRITPAEGGVWGGTIDIPAQGARNLTLTGFEVDSGRVRFSISGIPGDPTFQGTLSAEGQGGSLAGDFTQGGRTFPFRLRRSEAEAEAEAEAATSGTSAAAGALEGFDGFVESALETWKVPGLAVAIVKDGEVVLLKGYGLRDVKRNFPVTPDTLFAIGSSTKAFTVLSLAVLADDGKLDWDTPVHTYLPTFALEDEVAAARMTPRDLVTHRSGLPRHDLVWYNAPLSRKEIIERLRYLEPNADFRVQWQYQNLMFLTAGYLAGEVAQASWEELVRTRIFQPLGMTSANFSVAKSQATADFARPYNEKDDALQEIAFRNIDAVGPAGSINASLRDMARWVRLQLSDGAVDGVRVVSQSNLDETHRPQMVMRESGEDPEIVLPAYAMGWMVESYRGRKRLHHGGNIDGFSAMVTFLPADGIGVVALANKDGTPLPEIVCRVAIDRLLGMPAIDWSARLKARADEAEKAADKAKGSLAAMERKKGTRPSHPIEDYAGEYEHPAYGTVSVVRDAAAKDPSGLTASIHAIPMRLEHWHYDTFLAHPTDPALEEEQLFVTFETNTKGDLDALTMPLEPQVAEIRFARKPPARLSDPAFLETLTGTYALVDQPSATVAIALQGRILTAALTGQPTYTLEPYRGIEFRLKELTGYSIRFVLDPAGKVGEILLVQPDGVYAAKPRTKK